MEHVSIETAEESLYKLAKKRVHLSWSVFRKAWPLCRVLSWTSKSSRVTSRASPRAALPAEFIEKAICMKTKDQLYHRGKRDEKTACCS